MSYQIFSSELLSDTSPGLGHLPHGFSSHPRAFYQLFFPTAGIRHLKILARGGGGAAAWAEKLVSCCILDYKSNTQPFQATRSLSQSDNSCSTGCPNVLMRKGIQRVYVG